MKTEERIKTISETDGYTKHNHIIVEKVTEEEVIVSTKIQETSLNPYGIAHGGLLFSMADAAMGILGRLTGKNVVTVNAQIDYLKPGKSKKILCKAYPIKVGKHLAVLEAHLESEEGIEIAKVTGTYFYI